MPSPTREPASSVPSALYTELQPPPSPRTHRALRRLQSAHALGAANRAAAATTAAAIAPSSSSLISQQRQQQQQQIQNRSPTRQRTRANSDAATTGTLGAPANIISKRATGAAGVAVTKPVFSHGHLPLAQIIRDGPPSEPGSFQGALESARWKVIDEGVRSAEDGMSTVRIYVWLILLDAPVLPTDDYLALVHRGASPAYSKIRNDTFRTLTTDPLFRRRVSEASLIRLLNATAWMLHDAKEEERLAFPRPDKPGRSSMGGRLSLASNASESNSTSNFLSLYPLHTSISSPLGP